MIFVGSLLLLIGVVIAEEASSRSVPYKHFILPESKRHHLGLVLNSFAWLNIKERDNANEDMNWEVAKYTREWDICWSWEFSQLSQMGEVDSHHRINHLPGSYVIVSKDQVYKTIVELQNNFGKAVYDFIPRQFVLPEQKDEFIDAFKKRAKKNVPRSRARTDPDYGKRWLVKSQGHRGVRFFTGLEDLDNILTTKDMVAQCIEPFLIGGHKFDIGLYVAITSIDPLRIYVYENALLRICKLPYPKHLDETADKESYVVVDYLPPWENNALRRYYRQIPSASHEGTNHFHVLKQYMDSQGIDAIDFERSIYSSVVKMITGNRHHFLKSLGYYQKTYPRSNFSAQNFFEMWRFDFMVDDTGKPWLMEVNQSPNLKEKNFDKSGTDKAMKQGVAYDLLSMVTLQNTPLPTLPNSDSSYCALSCATQGVNMQNIACWSCPGWFAPDIRETVQRSAMEYAVRGKYRLLFPEISPVGQKVASTVHPPLHTFLSTKSPRDLALQRYFAAIFQAPKGSRSQPIVCVSREQCSSNGNCINGECVCDSGYEGRTCFVPSGNKALSDNDRKGRTMQQPDKGTAVQLFPRNFESWMLILVVGFGAVLLYQLVGRNKKEAKYKY